MLARLTSKFLQRITANLQTTDSLTKPTEDPVKSIEQEAEIDSCDFEVFKLDSNAVWKSRRLIATKHRCYLLASKSKEDKEFQRWEIVDSIPMHEIVRVDAMTRESLSAAYQADAALNKALRRKTKSMASSSDLTVASDVVTIVQKSRSVDSRTYSRDMTHPYFSYSALDNLKQVIQGPEMLRGFEIHTNTNGFNMGRTYYISADSEEHRDEWMDSLLKLYLNATKVFARNHKIELFQRRAQRIYNSMPFQTAIILAISANFLATLSQAQIGDGSQTCGSTSNVSISTAALADTNAAFDHLDLAFTVLFTAELLFNFSAHFFWPFFNNKFNWFDVIVVSISVGIIFVSSSGNGLVKQLRILRVFRVLRVFGRIGQLREIVNAITAAILPACQAFLIGLIVVAIYATIGTQFFGQEDPQGFCDFFHSFYTMFGVVAYSQADGLLAFDSNGNVRPGQVAYIYSFVAIVVFVLLQVVVAVLLDSFYRARQREKEQHAKEDAYLDRFAIAEHSPLEPLLERLATTFDTAENLDARLIEVFNRFDTDRTQFLSFSEFAEGMHKEYGQRLRIDDFESMTKGGTLCNTESELDRETFIIIIKQQLRVFCQHRMAEAQYNSSIGGEMNALLSAMKFVMIELEQAKKDVSSIKDEFDSDMKEIREQLVALANISPAPARNIDPAAALIYQQRQTLQTYAVFVPY